MKEKKWWVKVLITIASLVVKNQKGIKGTKNVDAVDEIKDRL
jgi:hypothetical protein